jgi:hypothetical protein
VILLSRAALGGEHANGERLGKRICSGRGWTRSSSWSTSWFGWAGQPIGGSWRESFGAVYTHEPGQPPLPARLMAGLAFLKHTFDLRSSQNVF